MDDGIKQIIPLGHIQSFLENVKSSIWFIPAIFVTSFIILSQIFIALDRAFFEELSRGAPWLFSGSPDAARNLLSTVASSIITVVSIAFSITIIALQQASTQYSPRVLRTFTSDKWNQIVLGMYIATFTYALLVLRVIRSSDDSMDAGFVPELSVNVAIFFVLICMGLLIFFIHQIASSLQVSEIIRHVHHDLTREIDTLFPESLGRHVKEPESAEQIMKKLRKRKSSVVKATQAGFVRLIDQEALSRVHVESSRWMYVHVRIGSFVNKGDVLVEVDSQSVSEKIQEKIKNTVIINSQRSIHQDALFGITQLVDIALRALSPGVNDPRTAVYCIHYLSDALCRLSTRKFPENKRTFENNPMTFVFNRPSWDSFVSSSFNQIRRETADSFRVTIALLDGLSDIVSCYSKESKRIAPLLLQVQAIEETSGSRIASKADKKIFKAKLLSLKKQIRSLS